MKEKSYALYFNTPEELGFEIKYPSDRLPAIIKVNRVPYPVYCELHIQKTNENAYRIYYGFGDVSFALTNSKDLEEAVNGVLSFIMPRREGFLYK